MIRSQLKKIALIVLASLPIITLSFSPAPELECWDVSNYYFQANCRWDLYEFKYQFQWTLTIFWGNHSVYWCNSLKTNKITEEKEIVRFDTSIEEVVSEIENGYLRSININDDVEFCYTSDLILWVEKHIWLWWSAVLFFLLAWLWYFWYKRLFRTGE